ncbi:MAG TPA: hypothetical protein VJH97_07395 [Candidatus Nanoarchaeia archaeon]|nr:hypothetical protein [Candidatus Nanoarchaeia archaeon]
MKLNNIATRLWGSPYVRYQTEAQFNRRQGGQLSQIPVSELLEIARGGRREHLQLGILPDGQLIVSYAGDLPGFMRKTFEALDLYRADGQNPAVQAFRDIATALERGKSSDVYLEKRLAVATEEQLEPLLRSVSTHFISHDVETPNWDELPGLYTEKKSPFDH